MNDPAPSDAPQPAPRVVRGQALLAWLVIVVIVGFILWRTATRASGENLSWLTTMQSQAKLLVGANALAPSGQGRQQLEQSEQSLNTGNYSQRLRYAILVGEMIGPIEAKEALEKLEGERLSPEDGDKLKAKPESIAIVALLLKLYNVEAGKEADPLVLSEEEQASIRSGLHWFGDLALGGRGATEQDRARALAPAQRSAVAAVIVGLSVMLMLGLGFVILVLFVVLWSFGHIREAVAANSGNGAIYAETFAWYMLLFLGLSYLMRLLNVTDFLANMIVMFGSLLAVAWPWLRGVSWETVREDIGLKGGWIDVLAGVGTYLSALPLLVLGILTSLGMMLLYRAITGDDPFMPGKGPSHPAAEVMFSRNWVDWVQMFVLAGICAPVVEEILFRGVLYRHFRDLSHRWAAGASFLFAALMSSFVFAAIHPQGIFGVPVLMALALAFSMAREWRGSLMPAIVAHGINNSAVTLLLLVTSI